MSIEKQIEFSKNMLNAVLDLINSCPKHKNFFDKFLCQTLSDINRKRIEDSLKESQIHLATLGILVIALALDNSRYKNRTFNGPAHLKNKNGSKTPFYPLNFEELISVGAFAHTSTSNVTIDNEKPEEFVTCGLVGDIANKIMLGELPFERENLIKMLGKCFSNHDKPCPYYSNIITFLESTKEKMQLRYWHVLSTPLTYFNPPNDAFTKAFYDLRNALDENFDKDENNFPLSKCMAIAEAASNLAEKARNKTLTKEDINQFKIFAQQYKKSHTLAIALAAVIGALIGMVAGAAAGFALGGIPGALIGGAAGMVIGSGITGVSSTMWYVKKEPLNKVADAATKYLQTSRS